MIDAKTEARLKGLFGKDKDGNLYLRTVQVETKEGELENAVNSRSNRSLGDILSNAIVLDTDGNPALRLAVVPFGKTVEQADRERRKKMAEEKAERLEKQKAQYKPKK